jgi:hypothetical protein
MTRRVTRPHHGRAQSLPFRQDIEILDREVLQHLDSYDSLGFVVAVCCRIDVNSGLDRSDDVIVAERNEVFGLLPVDER